MVSTSGTVTLAPLLSTPCTLTPPPVAVTVSGWLGVPVFQTSAPPSQPVSRTTALPLGVKPEAAPPVSVQPLICLPFPESVWVAEISGRAGLDDEPVAHGAHVAGGQVHADHRVVHVDPLASDDELDVLSLADVGVEVAVVAAERGLDLALSDGDGAVRVGGVGVGRAAGGDEGGEGGGRDGGDLGDAVHWLSVFLVVGEVRCPGCPVGFRCWVRLLCAPDW